MSSNYNNPSSLIEPGSSSGVGLGYGIAIAVGILVLVSTIMLVSYVCVRVNGNPRYVDDQPNFTTTNPTLYPPPITVVVGLDEPTIESYPKFANGTGPNTGPGPCPICLSKYRRDEILRSMPECDHVFHAKCVDEWLRVSATCPLCRNSPVPSAATTPTATPLSELIPLAVHGRRHQWDCDGINCGRCEPSYNQLVSKRINCGLLASCFADAFRV